MNTPDFRNYKNAEIDKTIDAAMTSLPHHNRQFNGS